MSDLFPPEYIDKLRREHPGVRYIRVPLYGTVQDFQAEWHEEDEPLKLPNSGSWPPRPGERQAPECGCVVVDLDDIGPEESTP